MFHLGIYLKMSCLITRAGLPSLLVLYAAKNILHRCHPEASVSNGFRVDQADVWDKLFLKTWHTYMHEDSTLHLYVPFQLHWSYAYWLGITLQQRTGLDLTPCKIAFCGQCPS